MCQRMSWGICADFPQSVPERPLGDHGLTCGGNNCHVLSLGIARQTWAIPVGVSLALWSSYSYVTALWTHLARNSYRSGTPPAGSVWPSKPCGAGPTKIDCPATGQPEGARVSADSRSPIWTSSSTSGRNPWLKYANRNPRTASRRDRRDRRGAQRPLKTVCPVGAPPAPNWAGVHPPGW